MYSFLHKLVLHVNIMLRRELKHTFVAVHRSNIQRYPEWTTIVGLNPTDEVICSNLGEPVLPGVSPR